MRGWGLGVTQGTLPQEATGAPGCDPLGTVVPWRLACGRGKVRARVLGALTGSLSQYWVLLPCVHAQ